MCYIMIVYEKIEELRMNISVFSGCRGGGDNSFVTSNASKKFDKKLRKCAGGFTLAEVLVTLGIIGVVSAMTIPTLMQNHQRKVYVTQLHKVYNEFQQAATAQMTDRNAINLTEAGVRSDAGMKTFLQNQFKVVKDCTGTPSNCFADSYTNMNGGAVTAYADTTAPCFVLASGATICAKYNPSKRLIIDSDSPLAVLNVNYIANLIGDLIIDINGKQGPNIVGRDLFILGIYSDGTISSALSRALQLVKPGETPVTNLAKCQRATSIARQSDASFCFSEILNNNWEMEY